MTKEEIKNTPELVDFMLDKCVLADSRAKVHKRLEEVCDMAIKTLEQEPCEDAIGRQAVLDIIRFEDKWLLDAKGHSADTEIAFSGMKSKVSDLPPVTPQPKTGHWSRKTKVDAYDIAGVKTWGIKCQCDRCDFTTIVVEDFGYYNYCPNCGVKMVEPQAENEGKK